MSSKIKTERARSSEQVKLNDFQLTWSEIGQDAQAAFARVGQSGHYILGPEVREFEAQFAAFSQVDHAIGCASGLDAIEIALRALDVGVGDQVLTTPLSAFATTLAILRTGATPTFVDVDEDGLLDLDLAEQAFSTQPTLRAVVPVHLYGRSLNLDKLGSLRDEFALKVVEDAAQAIGAHSMGRPVGTVGQLAAVSFYPTKNLGCFGDGGAIFCRDEELAQRCRVLRDYGQTSKYVHVEVGLNSRLDEVQAAVMRSAMLTRLQAWTERRRAIASLYGQSIRHPEVVLPAESPESVWHLYAIRAHGRDELMAHLSALGIQSAVHYPVLIPEQKALRGLAVPALPKARAWAQTVLSLPIHPYLSDDEVSRVVEGINSWRAS